MEIEKKRETSWIILLKQNDNDIELTSVEISGEVRQIKLTLLNKDKSVKVEMNKQEFFNFLSLLYAFKDVVIGEESTYFEDSLNYTEEDLIEKDNYSDSEENYPVNTEDSEDQLENNEREKLNPEEWDPW